MQFSVGVRNAILEAVEVIFNGQALTAGTGSGGSVTGTAAAPKLLFYTGAAPANCAAAAAGTLLLTMTLPADFMAAASAGAKALNGTWSATGSANGVAGHYRIVDSAGTTCNEQGTITATGGGGDLTLDNVNIANGQTVNITSKQLTAPNP